MHLPQHNWCTRKTALALEVNFHLDFHRVTILLPVARRRCDVTVLRYPSCIRAYRVYITKRAKHLLCALCLVRLRYPPFDEKRFSWLRWAMSKSDPEERGWAVVPLCVVGVLAAILMKVSSVQLCGRAVCENFHHCIFAIILVHCPTTLSIDLLTEWLTGCLRGCWLTGWLTDWLAEWFTDWLSDWMSVWLFDWLSDWLADWLAGWLTG